jgi:hypothetical protein
MPETDHFARRASSILAGAACNRATMAIARVWYWRHGSFLAGQPALMATKKRRGRYCVRQAVARASPERVVQRKFLCAKRATQHAPCGDRCRPPAVMPAKAGVHDFLCCNEGKSWIPAEACPRALDPEAGMPGGGTEESIIRALRIIRWSPHVASASRVLSATQLAHSGWIFAYIEQSPLQTARTITSHSAQSSGFLPPSSASSSPPMAGQAATPRERSAAAVRLCFAVL